MPAKNNEISGKRKCICHFLIKLFTIGSSKYHLIVVTLCFQGIDTTLNRLDLHHHTGKTAKRIIIYTPIFIFGIITKIMNINFSKALVLSAFHNRTIEKAFNHLGKNGYYINTHSLLIFRKFTNIQR